MRTSPWVYDKSIPFTGGGRYTRKKSAVRCPLIRWKTVRFSIEDRVIALPVFAPDYSDLAKLGKYSNHTNSAPIFDGTSYLSFRTFLFGSVIYIEGNNASFLSLRSQSDHYLFLRFLRASFSIPSNSLKFFILRNFTNGLPELST